MKQISKSLFLQLSTHNKKPALGGRFFVAFLQRKSLLRIRPRRAKNARGVLEMCRMTADACRKLFHLAQTCFHKVVRKTVLKFHVLSERKSRFRSILPTCRKTCRRYRMELSGIRRNSASLRITADLRNASLRSALLSDRRPGNSYTECED